MPTINLELQLKFLRDLDQALEDALAQYQDDGAEKLAELNYMKQEVARARRIVTKRLSENKADSGKGSYNEEALPKVAFS